MRINMLVKKNRKSRNRSAHRDKLIFDKGAKGCLGEIVFSTNFAESTGYPYEENLNACLILYSKVFKNGS